MDVSFKVHSTYYLVNERWAVTIGLEGKEVTTVFLYENVFCYPSGDVQGANMDVTWYLLAAGSNDDTFLNLYFQPNSRNNDETILLYNNGELLAITKSSLMQKQWFHFVYKKELRRTSENIVSIF